MNGDREVPEAKDLTTEESRPKENQIQEEQLNATAETDQPVDDEKDASPSVDELQRELELAISKSDSNWDKYIRAQAEMENLKRRKEKELQKAYKFGLENFFKELLPVVDSLELGIKAATGDSEEVVKLREGSELTLKQLLSVLEKFNCVALDPVGEVFNPEKHQAMSMQPTSDAQPNTVLTVFQKGYVLNERLLRPAMVVVAKAQETSTKIDEQA